MEKTKYYKSLLRRYKILGKTEDDLKNNWDTIQEYKRDSRSLQALSLKYCEIKGKQLYELYKSFSSKEELIKLLGEEKYKEIKLKNYKYLTLDHYIEKYGYDLGTEYYRKSKSRNLEFFICKYGEELGKEKYNSYIKKLKSNRTSKWSLEICETIKEYFPDLKYYGKKEKRLYVKKQYYEYLKKYVIMPDIYYNNKVIEFHGDVFHANPFFYNKTDKPHPFNDKIAKDIWELDEKKYFYYNVLNIPYMVIWENEYKNDKQGVIYKCLMFLT